MPKIIFWMLWNTDDILKTRFLVSLPSLNTSGVFVSEYYFQLCEAHQKNAYAQSKNILNNNTKQNLKVLKRSEYLDFTKNFAEEM